MTSPLSWRIRRSLGTAESFASYLLGFVLLAGLVASGHSAPRADAPVVPVIDLHVDLSYQVNYKGKPFDMGSGQFQASWLRAAGVMGVVLPLFVPHEGSSTGPTAPDLEASYAKVLAGLAHHAPFRFPGCQGVGQQGVATWLALEGAAPLADDDKSALRWVARGVRVFGLVHRAHNRLAASSTDPRKAWGLTSEGRALVEQIHRAGGIVDVSHADDATVDQVVSLALRDGVPVVASHSNARAVWPHARNLDDERLRRIAATGGLVGINFHAPYLNGTRHAELADVVRHLEHARRVAGIDHIGIGSDFEGGIAAPPELRDARGYQRLARALMARGWSRGAVEKAFSTNARRVLCGGNMR